MLKSTYKKKMQMEAQIMIKIIKKQNRLKRIKVVDKNIMYIK